VREIKFRIWNGVEWFHVDEFTLYDLEHQSNGHCFQQYTGLKDKDNKEIYEGDIVRFSEPTKLAEDCYMSTLYVFDFYNGSFLRPYIYNSINGGKFSKVGETKLNPVGRAKMEDNAHFDLTKAEVVGNIFETPFEIDL
jgi:uncharacterized phage protein (TIGR01671 family)